MSTFTNNSIILKNNALYTLLGIIEVSYIYFLKNMKKKE